MKKLLFILLAVLVLIAGCGDEPPKEQPKQTSAFNMDAKTFIEEYNKIAKDEVKIKEPKIEKGKKSTYSCRFKNKIEIMVVETDNKVESVNTFTFLPYDEKLFISVHDAVIGVLNSEVKNRTAVVFQLYDPNVKGFKGSITHVNTKYITEAKESVVTINARHEK